MRGDGERVETERPAERRGEDAGRVRPTLGVRPSPRAEAEYVVPGTASEHPYRASEPFIIIKTTYMNI